MNVGTTGESKLISAFAEAGEALAKILVVRRNFELIDQPVCELFFRTDCFRQRVKARKLFHSADAERTLFECDFDFNDRVAKHAKHDLVTCSVIDYQISKFFVDGCRVTIKLAAIEADDDVSDVQAGFHRGRQIGQSIDADTILLRREANPNPHRKHN